MVGTLRTTNGLAVLDAGNGQITIPDTTTGQIGVSEAGTIYLLDAEGGRSEVGQLAVVNIDDPLKLQRKSDTAVSLEQGRRRESPVEARKDQSRAVYRDFQCQHDRRDDQDDRRSPPLQKPTPEVIKSYSAIQRTARMSCGTLG